MDRFCLILVWPAFCGCFVPELARLPEGAPSQSWVVQDLDPQRPALGVLYTGTQVAPHASEATGTLALYAYAKDPEALQLEEKIFAADPELAPRPMSTSTTAGAERWVRDAAGWRRPSPTEIPPLGLPPFDWPRCVAAGGCAGEDPDLCVMPCPAPALPALPEETLVPCALMSCQVPSSAPCSVGEQRIALGCVPIGDGCPIAPERFGPDLPPGAIYADRTAIAPGDGSRARPYRTLAEALGASGPGAVIALSEGDFDYPASGPALDRVGLVGACQGTRLLVLADGPIHALGEAELTHLRIDAEGVAVELGPGAYRLESVTIVAGTVGIVSYQSRLTLDRVLIEGESGIQLGSGSTLVARGLELSSASTGILAVSSNLSIEELQLTRRPVGPVPPGLRVEGSTLSLSLARISGQFFPAISLRSASTGTIEDVEVEASMGGIEVRQSDAVIARARLVDIGAHGLSATGSSGSEGIRCEDELRTTPRPRVSVTDLTITQSQAPLQPCPSGTAAPCAALSSDCGVDLSLGRASIDSVGATIYLGERSTAVAHSIVATTGRCGGLAINKVDGASIKGVVLVRPIGDGLRVERPQVNGGIIEISDLSIEDAGGNGLSILAGEVALTNFRIDRGQGAGASIGKLANVRLRNGSILDYALAIEIETAFPIPSSDASSVALEALRGVQTRALPSAPGPIMTMRQP